VLGRFCLSTIGRGHDGFCLGWEIPSATFCVSSPCALSACDWFVTPAHYRTFLIRSTSYKSSVNNNKFEHFYASLNYKVRKNFLLLRVYIKMIIYDGWLLLQLSQTRIKARQNDNKKTISFQG
jgi:hypothetical protein